MADPKNKDLGSAAQGAGDLFTGAGTGNVGQWNQGLNNFVGGVGGEFQTLSNSFVPQNNFQATSAPITQQNFGHAINTGLGQFGQNYANQNALAGQLQAQSLGAGPNPAQNMLNQATNNNIMQNTGMIASQKGINPALAARMASENAGAMNQNAAGQAATMGSQQQLGAQQNLSGLYGQMGNQQNSMQSTLQNAQAAQNNAIVSNQNSMNAINQQTAAGNAKANQGGLSGLGSIAGIAAMFSQGGMVQAPQHLADGGPVMSSWGYNMSPGGSGPQSAAGQYLSGDDKPAGLAGLSSIAGKFKGSGSSAPAENTWDYNQFDGSMAGGAGDNNLYGSTMYASKGGNVPGKAMIQGNSPKNDTVPAMLSPGEIVIPRSVMESKNAPQDAAKFVAAILARKGLKKGIAS